MEEIGRDHFCGFKEQKQPWGKSNRPWNLKRNIFTIPKSRWYIMKSHKIYPRSNQCSNDTPKKIFTVSKSSKRKSTFS